MRILLVNPGSDGDILTRVMREIPYLGSDAFFAPHSLAAVAAATPDGHEVRIHDENLHGPADALLADGAFDVMGITLTTNQLKRTTELLDASRTAGSNVHRVVGGIGAGTMLSALRPRVDTLFWGEVEETWPRFLSDLEAGQARNLYETVSKPDMAETMPPRWDLIAGDVPRYGAMSVQTARGCPFDCAFCDVIYTYGRAVRQKPVDRVLEEVATARRLGAKVVMFADDSFAADRKYVKELLRRLVDLNNGFRVPMGFLTQLDITVADDEELLELLADANFHEVQIGIESTSIESLQDMDKRQNLRMDPVAAVRRIQSYGVSVMAHLIIGADHDDLTAFDRTASFLKAANITHHQCHPLTAPPGTKLWYRYKREGRLIAFSDEMRDRLDITTNIVPVGMTRLELMEGLADYWDRVHEPADYLPRALGFLEGVTRRSRVKEAKMASLWENRAVMARTIAYYSMKVTPEHRKAFFEVVAATRKRAPWLMNRMMFMHTGYLMDVKRAKHASAIARDQAARERADPSLVQLLPTSTPLPQAVRDQAPAIARAAWDALKGEVHGRDGLMRLAIAALVDYTDRFGQDLEAFDETHAGHVRASCERVLAAHDQAMLSEGGVWTGNGDGMPSGFARELLDALDRTLHMSNGGWDAAESR